MSWEKGFNFRGSEAYVADGVDETYVIDGDTYPVTRNGVTFGEEDAFDYELDRLSSNDRRLAGVFGHSATGSRFRVDLPATGVYNYRLALGDASFSAAVGWLVKDETIVLDTYAGTAGINEFMDAAGTVLPADLWLTSNVAVERTFTSTILRLVVNEAHSLIAHLRIEEGPASIPPSCLITDFRDILFDPITGLVTIAFAMQVYLPDGGGVPQLNPDSASVTFDSTQDWADTKEAIHAAVTARCLEFDIAVTPSNIIMRLPPIERG